MKAMGIYILCIAIVAAVTLFVAYPLWHAIGFYPTVVVSLLFSVVVTNQINMTVMISTIHDYVNSLDEDFTLDDDDEELTLNDSKNG